MGGNESAVLEFKSQIDHNHILKTCSAFGNSSGGILLIGVKDNPLRHREKSPESAVNLQVGDSLTTVTSILSDGFYYNSPLYEVDYLPKLGILAILVYGNEREPILYISKDKAIAGARRKNNSSNAFSVEETLATADRWHKQREIIMERFRRNHQLLLKLSLDLRRSDLLVSTIPVPAFSRPPSLGFINQFPEIAEEYLPGLSLSSSSASMSVTFERTENAQPERFHINQIDSGCYHIHTTSVGHKVNGCWLAHESPYVLTVSLALYTCALMSYVESESVMWSVQGSFCQFDETQIPKAGFQSEPVLISLPMQYQKREDPFPKLSMPGTKSTDFIDLLKYFASSLCLDMESVLAPQNDQLRYLCDHWQRTTNH